MSADETERMGNIIKARLLNLAEKRGEDYNIVLTRYIFERFLYRLYCSPYRNEFVLKGAMLFQLWRPMLHLVDLDSLAGRNSDFDIISHKITTICTTEVAEDGVRFDLNGLSINDIQDGARCNGKRVKFSALLSSIRIPIQIDIDMGNPITLYPSEVEYLALLRLPPPRILVYSHTVIAEKLAAIITMGVNTRMQDFLDLWFFFTTFDDDLQIIGIIVEQAFGRWELPVPYEVPIGLSDELANDFLKQNQWREFLECTLYGELPWDQVITIIRNAAMRIFAAAREWF